MHELRRCPRCLNPLPDQTPLGGCPTCMLAEGLRDDINAAQLGISAADERRWTAPSATDLDAAFPQFTVTRLLAQGGMGAVYHAKQELLGREVALKVLPEQISEDPAFAERFVREARALAQLTHPNIVTVYEFGKQGNLFFLVMEFVDGFTLRDTISGQAPTAIDASTVVAQVCEALDYAHQQGIVHRDIKPENILLDTQGRVKIADFGLAKLREEVPHQWHLTGTHQVMGTPHYMAPEQIEHPLDVDHRADLYSLGVVFYELLTGRLPLGRFKVPSELVHSDPALDAIVLTLLEREPSDRYQTASALRDALPIQDDTPWPRRDRSVSPSQRVANPGPILAGGITMLLGGCLLVYGLRRGYVFIWCGLGLLLSGSYSVSTAFESSKTDGPVLKTPNLGSILNGVILIWLGVTMLLGNYMGFGIWIGIGMVLGGGNVLAKAWTPPDDGQLRPWQDPNISKILSGGTMLAVGVALFLWGSMSPHVALFWVGFGLSIGGGNTLENAWRIEAAEAQST